MTIIFLYLNFTIIAVTVVVIVVIVANVIFFVITSPVAVSSLIKNFISQAKSFGIKRLLNRALIFVYSLL